MPVRQKPIIPFRGYPDPSTRFSVGAVGQRPKDTNATNLAKGLYGLMGLKLAPETAYLRLNGAGLTYRLVNMVYMANMRTLAARLIIGRLVSVSLLTVVK